MIVSERLPQGYWWWTWKITNRTLNACVGSAIEFTGVHHVGFLCENVEKSLDFYCGLLGTLLSYLYITVYFVFLSPSRVLSKFTRVSPDFLNLIF
jgi:hypothetical protein